MKTMVARRSFLFLLCLCFISCIKWNLERFEIISFNNDVVTDTIPGFNLKNGITQTNQNNYLIVGTSSLGNVLITNISEEGEFVSSNELELNGEGHCIVQDPTDNGVFLVLASSVDNFFLAYITPNGSLIKIDSFKSAINGEIGLVEKAIALDVITTSQGNLLFTGTIKQTLGPSNRLMLLSLSAENKSIEWVRSYDENHIGYSLIENGNGDLTVLGEKNNKTVISSYMNSGNFKWQNDKITTSKEVFKNIVSWQDTLVFFAIEDNDSGNISIKGIDFEGDIKSEIQYTPSFPNNSPQSGYLLPNKKGNLNYVDVNCQGNSDCTISFSELNDLGQILWTRTFVTVNASFLSIAARQVKDSGFLIFGVINQGDEVNYQLIKTDEEGIIRQ